MQIGQNKEALKKRFTFRARSRLVECQSLEQFHSREKTPLPVSLILTRQQQKGQSRETSTQTVLQEVEAISFISLL